MTESAEMTVKQGDELEAGSYIVSIERVYRDKNLIRVEVTTADGAFAIVTGQYQGLSVVVPAVETKFAVVGELEGLVIHELFTLRHEADARFDVLDAKGATVEVVEEEVRG